ncbi:MAG: GTPase [Candidatus Diapherotrites archaeon]
MTTNAGPEFFAAQKKYQEASTHEAKLEALKEMLRFAPKHKSSENLVAEITFKIAKLKKELERQKELQAKKGSGASLNIKKEGAGQVVIVGMPNSGKSTLLKNLTNVNVEIAPYPFTTTKPEVGMMNYEGALVQIVEVPAIVEGSSEGKANGTQLLSLVRNADAIILLYRSLEEKDLVVKELEKANIVVVRSKPKITIQHNSFNGLNVSGKNFLKISEERLLELLKKYGVQNCDVILEEEATEEKIVEVLESNTDYKPCLFLQTGFEYKLNDLKERIFKLLNKIIVYTKKPGFEPDLSKPLVLKEGSTIKDAAELVHKEIAKNLKYARLWGSAKFPGQRVSKDYKLQNKDIIEINA